MADKSEEIIAHKVKSGLTKVKGIKNIIAVTSGKGGVGKSTTAINIAISLKNMGLQVGVLDADIYGPSIPTLVGGREYKPEVVDKCFVPLDNFGLKIMSFGFLVSENQPAIWRGAIVNKAIEQMLYDTLWGDLDCLIIDMPPGTGDIHLTMCQKMPITATVVVTTPQDIALIDVIKSVEMYKKLSIPALGVIENMSTHTCSKCGHTEAVFGDEGGKNLASQYNMELLGQLPLNINIRTSSDNGIPVSTENDEIALIYKEVANNMLVQLAKLSPDEKDEVAETISDLIDK